MSKSVYVYFLSYNKCPVACYTLAWMAFTCIRLLISQGFNDLNLWKVIRYKSSRSGDIKVDATVVTDSFLRSLKDYGVL